MLKDAHVAVTIPSQDLKRARQFYADKLGLTPAEETPAGLEYKVGDGSGFLLFQSSGKASGAHTQMAFDVDDVRADHKHRQILHQIPKTGSTNSRFGIPSSRLAVVRGSVKFEHSARRLRARVLRDFVERG